MSVTFGGPPMGKIIVDVGKQMDGMTFRLSPKTRIALPSRPQSQPLPSSVFVSYETKSDFEQNLGPLREHIVMMLTGLDERQITKLGDLQFVLQPEGKILFDSNTLH
jgi:hypothetical protein